MENRNLRDNALGVGLQWRDYFPLKVRKVGNVFRVRDAFKNELGGEFATRTDAETYAEQIRQNPHRLAMMTGRQEKADQKQQARDDVIDAEKGLAKNR